MVLDLLFCGMTLKTGNFYVRQGRHTDVAVFDDRGHRMKILLCGLLTKRVVKMAILAKFFFFACLSDRDEVEVHKYAEKNPERTRPISRHLGQTSLVKGFIIWQ